jgi:hypothetical protein
VSTRPLVASIVVFVVATTVVVVVGERVSSGAPTAAEACIVDATYQVFLKRPATATEVGSWSSRFATGEPEHRLPGALAVGEDWLAAEVTALYRQALDRDPEPGGLAYWSGELRRGVLVNRVGTLIYGSSELYSRAGGTPRAFVADLYRRILRRELDPEGADYWVGELGRRSRGGVAAQFFASVESRSGRVDRLYQEILGRAADPDGRVYWIGQLRTVNDVRLAVLLASSEEFRARAQTSCSAPAVATDRLDGAKVGAPALWTLVAQGGRPPYTWHVGGLPAGLALVGDAVEGTPTAVGTHPVVVTVTDDRGVQASRAIELAVQAPGTTTLEDVMADAPDVNQTVLAEFKASDASQAVDAAWAEVADLDLDGTDVTCETIGPALDSLLVDDFLAGLGSVPDPYLNEAYWALLRGAVAVDAACADDGQIDAEGLALLANGRALAEARAAQVQPAVASDTGGPVDEPTTPDGSAPDPADTSVVAADDSDPLRWWAYGDSFASGEGIIDVDDGPRGQGEDGATCQRANGRAGVGSAWAAEAYSRFDLLDDSTFVMVACTGAITDDIEAQKRQATDWANDLPDVMSFSFGGNNLNFGGVLANCIDIGNLGAAAGPIGEWLAGWKAKAENVPDRRRGCDHTLEEMTDRVDDLVSGDPYRGTTNFEALLDRSTTLVQPNGHIVVMGYQNLFEDPDLWPALNRYVTGCQGVAASDADLFRAIQSHLNQRLEAAVVAAGARHPDVTFHWFDPNDVHEGPAGRHSLCASGEPWMNGFTTGLLEGSWRVDRSYHPNRAGHAAIGAWVAQRLDLDFPTFDPGGPPGPPLLDIRESLSLPSVDDLPGSSLVATSTDARAVAFSTQEALVPSDADNFVDVYVWRPETGAYALVSGGAGPSSTDAVLHDLSDDGRFVSWVRYDEDSLYDSLHLTEVATWRTVRVTRRDDFGIPWGGSLYGGFTDGDAELVYQVYTDWTSIETRAFSLATGRHSAVVATSRNRILTHVSHNGRWLLFEADDSPSPPNDDAGPEGRDVYLFDREARTWERVPRTAGSSDQYSEYLEGEAVSDGGDVWVLEFSEEGCRLRSWARGAAATVQRATLGAGFDCTATVRQTPGLGAVIRDDMEGTTGFVDQTFGAVTSQHVVWFNPLCSSGQYRGGQFGGSSDGDHVVLDARGGPCDTDDPLKVVRLA